MNLRELRKGQPVIVSNPTMGTVRALVENVEMVSTLPAIPGAPPVNEVRRYLQGAGIKQIAAISYRYGPGRVAFVAFGDGRGAWCDLHDQKLTITTPNGFKTARKHRKP